MNKALRGSVSYETLREQCRRAMTLVVVGHRADAGLVESLNWFTGCAVRAIEDEGAVSWCRAPRRVTVRQWPCEAKPRGRAPSGDLESRLIVKNNRCPAGAIPPFVRLGFFHSLPRCERRRRPRLGHADGVRSLIITGRERQQRGALIMVADPPKAPPQLDEVDVRYGRGTVPQGPLPFHIRVRRMHPWWPGPERYGKLIDRLILAAAVSPGIVWASLAFGWKPVLFILAEALIIRLTIYRVLNGTFLD
jgi:hypothetical protein